MVSGEAQRCADTERSTQVTCGKLGLAALQLEGEVPVLLLPAKVSRQGKAQATWAPSLPGSAEPITRADTEPHSPK